MFTKFEVDNSHLFFSLRSEGNSETEELDHIAITLSTREITRLPMASRGVNSLTVCCSLLHSRWLHSESFPACTWAHSS